MMVLRMMVLRMMVLEVMILRMMVLRMTVLRMMVLRMMVLRMMVLRIMAFRMMMTDDVHLKALDGIRLWRVVFQKDTFHPHCLCHPQRADKPFQNNPIDSSRTL